MRAIPMLACVFAAVFLSGKLMPNVSFAQDREPIGHVLGEVVYRDQLTATEGRPLAVELHRLFSEPLWIRYRAEHREEIAPTEEEIRSVWMALDQRYRLDSQRDFDRAFANLEEFLDTRSVWEASIQFDRRARPDEAMTTELLKHWQFQKHLYDTFGGGRVLECNNPPVGDVLKRYEAFDAARVWLERQESQGRFAITDASLRREFYAYWTTHDHGDSLISEPKRIRDEFLDPLWLK
jgi:hypothetical protein